MTVIPTLALDPDILPGRMVVIIILRRIPRPSPKSQTTEPRNHRAIINPTIYAAASLDINSSYNLTGLLVVI